MSIRLRFLGVGSSGQTGLGHASAVVESAEGNLLIDCGPGVLQSYLSQYGALPESLFITHCHFDHVGDFENLFIRAWFSQEPTVRPQLFVPAAIIPLMQKRVACYPNVLAEGGVNFWDAFRLVPVDDFFYWKGFRFLVHEVRHHAPKSAYGLHLPEAFFFTGDTRPIPEVLNHAIGSKEMIFHDCGVEANPSHTGIDDLTREYSPELVDRMRFYHYAKEADVEAFEHENLMVVKSGEVFDFSF